MQNTATTDVPEVFAEPTGGKSPIGENLSAIWGPIRSGTNPLLVALANARTTEGNPAVGKILNQIGKSGLREKGEFNYGPFFAQTPDGNRALIKETLGFRRKPECDFKLLPPGREAEVAEKVPVLAIVRHPFGIISSMVARKWHEEVEPDPNNPENTEHFIDLIQVVFESLMRNIESAERFGARIECVVHGHIHNESDYHQEEVFRRICKHLKIPFSREILDWSVSFDKLVEEGKMCFCDDIHRDVYQRGWYDRVRESSGFHPKESLITLKEGQVAEITRRKIMMDIYEEIQERSKKFLEGAEKTGSNGRF